MFKGEIKSAYKDGRIDRVCVLRLCSKPGQTDREFDVREHNNYRYLLLFIPSKEGPDARRTPKDYFIFLNRLDKPNEIRWYKSIFTATQDIAKWGFKSYEFFNLTEYGDLEDAFGHLRMELTKRKISIMPVRRFMDDLVNKDRGLPIISRRRKAVFSA